MIIISQLSVFLEFQNLSFLVNNNNLIGSRFSLPSWYPQNAMVISMFGLNLQDYAKTDGLEYICPHCSISNFKKKQQKVTNGFAPGLTASRPP